MAEKVLHLSDSTDSRLSVQAPDALAIKGVSAFMGYTGRVVKKGLTPEPGTHKFEVLDHKGKFRSIEIVQEDPETHLYQLKMNFRKGGISDPRVAHLDFLRDVRSIAEKEERKTLDEPLPEILESFHRENLTGERKLFLFGVLEETFTRTTVNMFGMDKAMGKLEKLSIRLLPNKISVFLGGYKLLRGGVVKEIRAIAGDNIKMELRSISHAHSSHELEMEITREFTGAELSQAKATLQSASDGPIR